MITKIYKLLYAGLVGIGMTVGLTACTDTWDDHYDAAANGVLEGSLWEAIEQNPELSNFASVLKATGYDKSLGGSQVFTVFAPTNSSFSAAEAGELINAYNTQKAARVNDENNTVIKEFVQNHLALYNYSVSSLSDDSITMMNGKYAVLKSGTLGGVPMLSSNSLYQNGVLFTMGSKIEYEPNIFEYFRLSGDMDSVCSFLYNDHFYYKVFQASQSVPGGIENGKTIYLDSVFTQNNELFANLGRLATEDSTYYMVAPNNEQWRQLLDSYAPYFDYDPKLDERDSIVYTNLRLAILEGTTFSRTFNKMTAALDTAMSNNAVKSFSSRKNMWGAPFHYYQYDDPLKSGGVLGATNVVKCSNGSVYRPDQWPIDKLQTFCRYIIVEAEAANSIKEVSKTKDTKGDSIPTVNTYTRYVANNNVFYDKVWNNGFVEFKSANTLLQHSVKFNITNVLSNMPYDIYLITAPALANDSNATSAERLPTMLTCDISYRTQENKTETKRLVTKVETHPDDVDYILLAENFVFPVCTYNLSESEPSTVLTVSTDVLNRLVRSGTHNRDMRIDCILLVPHGTMEVTDNEVVMKPHGETTRTNSLWVKKR